MNEPKNDEDKYVANSEFLSQSKLIKMPTDKSTEQRIYQLRVPRAFMGFTPIRRGKLWNNLHLMFNDLIFIVNVQ